MPSNTSSYEECGKEYEVTLEGDVLGRLDMSLGSVSSGGILKNYQYCYFFTDFALLLLLLLKHIGITAKRHYWMLHIFAMATTNNVTVQITLLKHWRA